MSRFKSRFSRKFEKGEFQDKFAIDETSGAYVSKCDYIDPMTGGQRNIGGRDEELAADGSVFCRFSDLDISYGTSDQREYERMINSLKVIKKGDPEWKD